MWLIKPEGTYGGKDAIVSSLNFGRCTSVSRGKVWDQALNDNWTWWGQCLVIMQLHV